MAERALTKKRKAEFLERYRNVFNVTKALAEMDLKRSAFESWIRRSARFRKQFEQVRDELADVLESELLKQVKAGSTQATIYALNNVGKHRGWATKHEISGPGGGPVLYQVIDRFIGAEDHPGRTKDHPSGDVQKVPGTENEDDDL